MNTPLGRLRLEAFVLAAIFVTAAVGYRVLGGWTWLDSIYMVVITISTVGYKEIGEMDDVLKAFTIVVIVVGISAVAYTVGGFMQMVAEGEINRALGMRRATRDIDKLKEHVIICGFGRIGQILAEEMRRRNQAFVIVDNDNDRLADAREMGILALGGDATEEDTLEKAGIDRAKSLVSALAADADNVFITLTSRNRNPKLQIIARGELPSTQKKLIQAGADRVVLPAAIGAQRIANMVTRPSVVELMELVSGESTLDIEVDELLLPSNSSLIGKTVAETEAHRAHGLLVVAVKRAEGEMVFKPDADFDFQPDDTVIVMGRVDDIQRFRRHASV